MIKMEQLYYLTQIAKYGSINKAAEMLYMTSSAISASMKHLEKECGYTILERTYRGVKFTKEGEFALKKAEEILQIAKEMQQYTEMNRKPKTKLYIARNLLKMLSNQIIGQTSKVLDEFDVVEVEDVTAYKNSLSGNAVLIDIIGANEKKRYDSDKSLQIEYLYHSKRYPVSNKNTKHIGLDVQRLSKEDLETLPKIKLKGDNVLPDQNVVLTTDDPTIYAEAILNDYGIGVISRFAEDIFVVDYTMFKLYEPLDDVDNYLAIIAHKTCDIVVLTSLKEKIMDK